MARLFERLRRIVGNQRRGEDRRPGGRRRQDPPYVGGSSVKDIEKAPPGRAQELAGHAVERVET